MKEQSTFHSTLKSCYYWFSFLKTGNHEPWYQKDMHSFTFMKPHWVLYIPLYTYYLIPLNLLSDSWKPIISDGKAKIQASGITEHLKTWIQSLADRKASSFCFCFCFSVPYLAKDFFKALLKVFFFLNEQELLENILISNCSQRDEIKVLLITVCSYIVLLQK